MAAVYISRQAVDDLKNIFTALITWEKGPLEIKHALQYVDDIEAKCFFRWQTKRIMSELHLPPISCMEIRF